MFKRCPPLSKVIHCLQILKRSLIRRSLARQLSHLRLRHHPLPPPDTQVRSWAEAWIVRCDLTRFVEMLIWHTRHVQIDITHLFLATGLLLGYFGAATASCEVHIASSESEPKQLSRSPDVQKKKKKKKKELKLAVKLCWAMEGCRLSHCRQPASHCLTVFTLSFDTSLEDFDLNNFFFFFSFNFFFF